MCMGKSITCHTRLYIYTYIYVYIYIGENLLWHDMPPFVFLSIHIYLCLWNCFHTYQLVPLYSILFQTHLLVTLNFFPYISSPLTYYGVATISRLLKIIGLFCKRALQKRLYSAEETYDFKEPTNRSHPIRCPATHC